MASDPLSREAVIEAVQTLVRVPSVNPLLAPGEGTGEVAVTKAACNWFAARGIRAWTEDAAPGRPNAVAEVGDGNGPTLVLCAHIDTVGTKTMTIPPFEPRVEGNRLYGRGTVDMKASAGAIMSAMASLAQTGLHGHVMAALVADEEYTSLGADDFVRRHKADACIVTEASDGELTLAHKGFVWAELIVKGYAAHGSRWDIGVSAIGKMAKIVTALETFDRDVLRKRVHPLVGPASMHCALIQGGTGISTYAPECRLEIERRTLPGETAEQVERELHEIAAQAGEEVTIRRYFDRLPFTADRDARITRSVREAAQAVTGKTPKEVGVSYWMDAAVFAGAGIPTVNFGPSGNGAHEDVEWSDIDSVVSCARVLAEASRRFCRQEKSAASN